MESEQSIQDISLEKLDNPTFNNPSSKFISPTRLPLPEEYVTLLKEKGLEQQAEAYQEVIGLARAIQENSGQALLVGGFVRDQLLSKDPKDYDIEVYGLEQDKIKQIIGEIGNVNDVGQSFAVLKVNTKSGQDLDISLPRTDSKTGDGHKGFDVTTNPFMSIDQAAKRRDFTINAMLFDPLTGTIYDPFNGVQDLKDRRLKITDAELFQDDPLRIIRGMQFVGRFNLTIEGQSLALMQEMSPRLKELPKARIFEEWKKLLLKSSKPSTGLIAGMEIGVFKELHPELMQLDRSKPRSQLEPIQDNWVHTLTTVDKTALITKRENLSEEDSLIIMLGAICSNLAGQENIQPNNNKDTSFNNPPSSTTNSITNFLESIGIIGKNNIIRLKVMGLVQGCKKVSPLYAREAREEKSVSNGHIRELAREIYPATIKESILLAEARASGDNLALEPGDNPLSQNDFPAGLWLINRAKAIGVESSKPQDVIMGKDLIQIGLKPGSEFTKIIDLCNKLRDKNESGREDILNQIAGLNAQEIADRLYRLAQ